MPRNSFLNVVYQSLGLQIRYAYKGPFNINLVVLSEN
jgi:hypothetical protein